MCVNDPDWTGRGQRPDRRVRRALSAARGLLGSPRASAHAFSRPRVLTDTQPSAYRPVWVGGKLPADVGRDRPMRSRTASGVGVISPRHRFGVAASPRAGTARWCAPRLRHDRDAIGHDRHAGRGPCRALRFLLLRPRSDAGLGDGWRTAPLPASLVRPRQQPAAAVAGPSPTGFASGVKEET